MKTAPDRTEKASRAEKKAQKQGRLDWEKGRKIGLPVVYSKRLLTTEAKRGPEVENKEKGVSMEGTH